MGNFHNEVDPHGLHEYSVVFTDRSLNHMSDRFGEVMRDISSALRRAYSAFAVAIVPGGGSFAMEAVARQFAGDKQCLVIRNGWFSYRWTQIFEMGDIPQAVTVLKARQATGGNKRPFSPPPIAEVVEKIKTLKPEVVFAPHVETSSGIMLPESYLREVAQVTRAVGGIFVLDCIASGAIWVDMRANLVDVLITAPQKGWSSTPCSGAVLLSERAAERLTATTSTSFCCDLLKWRQIMEAYENGGHAYHATMPTDSLLVFRNAIQETERLGLPVAGRAQEELGGRIRTLLGERGMPSVAAAGYESPAVVVSYTDDAEIHNGKKFAAVGLQIAAGVPLMCDEPENFQTFRIGLFGIDKLEHIDQTVSVLEAAIDRVLS